MFKKPFPRIVAATVVAMIAAAAVLTFTRGETPATDTASATLPGVSGTSGPVVVGSPNTPKPSSHASADATERDAEKADSKATKTPTKTPTQGGRPTGSPTTTPPKDPDPEPEPSPSPSPSPTPTRNCGVFVILGCK